MTNRPCTSATASGKSKSARPVRIQVTDADAIAALTDSARRGELVVVIGSGVSMGLTDGKVEALSWNGLIRNGFAYGVKKGLIADAQLESWKPHLSSSDLDELLGAAEFMGRKLGAPNGELYARWLRGVFESVRPTNRNMEKAVRAIHAAGIPLCTLNYDQLLERVTGLSTINMSEINKATEWMRVKFPTKRAGVLHLHGAWEAPQTCILGIRDYETTVADDVRDLIQRCLAAFSRLLFVGCGGTFADPNFTALIEWLRKKMKAATPQHYALVNEAEVTARHKDPAWQGFVEPASYGAIHTELPTYLLNLFAPLKKAPESKRAGSVKVAASTAEHERLLQDYRAFLLKDCGQMTIEGVRADMKTAERRFDLERLFVPLEVLPTPPELPDADPEREQKLLKWHEKNKAPHPFGKVFAEHARLALLALPGGGKTLLLKRLTVAYAEPSRRLASNDALPDLDLTPVLIRCREWREHIHRPILTLMQNISDITGQPALKGLSNALLPLFANGKILLLVDGLDEIHDDGLRKTFVDHLETFLEEYQLTRLVVTSREAGFSLVAPSLARFCQRWRVAPLEPDAITALCAYWHRLMTGESPEAEAEASAVAQQLLQNASLLRLAENPLLLTMLLVVKHGAGRLPPDRVTLYMRAVEVLLDTWNIKGHEPLNVKEAVPQLAFVAFQLMRAGKQTATETELLALLAEGRERVPQIRLYAKDTPFEFLRRVELRSSLLVEAGHQPEGARTVPFYQFRHLTFQEYLAAVAAVEGHYPNYKKHDTLLTPLASYLTAEEWKEVIPMAAVLGRKQAEPLLAALVTRGSKLRQALEAGQDFNGKKQWIDRQMPEPVARLLQCLVEEAEFAPETLSSALQLVAIFAKAGGTDQSSFLALCRGPYGEELLHQAWLLYAPMNWPREAWLVTSCAMFAAFRHTGALSNDSEKDAELDRLLRSRTHEEIARGLFIWIWLQRGRWEGLDSWRPSAFPHEVVERTLSRENLSLQVAAAYAWGLNQHQSNPSALPPSPRMLDRLLTLWSTVGDAPARYVAFALASQLSRLRRRTWTPVLTKPQMARVRNAIQNANRSESDTSLLVAFHARNVWTEEELALRLAEARSGRFGHEADALGAMLAQMGNAGRKYLKSRTPRAKKIRQGE